MGAGHRSSTDLLLSVKYLFTVTASTRLKTDQILSSLVSTGVFVLTGNTGHTRCCDDAQ